MGLTLDSVNKTFANVQAIKNLSLEVEAGTIFGFLGPNGAGKTTTIRMILDIIRPDSGQILWNGQKVSSVARKTWGYLPEERGLYSKMTVRDHLIFLGRLYGVAKPQLERELEEWLERFQIADYQKKRIEELSKGNQQKIQVLATLLHDPEILLMDEPLSGLDPVNGILLKEAFLELQRRGKTIVFSTHQMEQAEELCQYIVIINKGQIVTQGSIQDVKRQSGKQVVRLALDHDREVRWLDSLPGVNVIKRRQDYIELCLAPNITPDQLLQTALHQGGQITRFELALPSLTDIFIQQVTGVSAPEAAPSKLTVEQ